jgi:RNA polymerase sigma factor (sigma-70 family)
MTEFELQALARHAQQGDALALDALLRHAREGMEAYLARLVSDRFLVDDALQEALLVICKQLRTYQARGQFRAWAKAIARNCLRRERRRARAAREAELAADHFQIPALNRPAEHSDLEEAVQALSARTARLLKLRYYEGYSVTELAAYCRTTPGNLAVELQRARARVRAILTRSA